MSGSKTLRPVTGQVPPFAKEPATMESVWTVHSICGREDMFGGGAVWRFCVHVDGVCVVVVVMVVVGVVVVVVVGG